MATIPLIRVSNFLPFIDFLNALGSPVEGWLEAAQLSPLALEDPELLLCRHLALAFVKNAAYKEGIENLGLLVGQKAPISGLGNFGRLLCSSLTLNQALTTLQTLAPMHNSGELWWRKELIAGESEQPDDRIWFCMRHTDSVGTYIPYASQFALAQITDLISLAAGKGWQPLAIAFQTRHAWKIEPSLRGIPVRSGVGFTGVCFPRSLLSLPLQSSFVLTDEQIQQNRDRLHQSAPAQSLPNSLQQALIPLLRSGYPDIRFTAMNIGWSVRTLQRRLQAEGITYSRLVEKTRFERAMDWLTDSSLSLIDISMELGYSDAAHFSRAFKRWAGISPQAFRRARQTADND
jgi:AraC-like DNA-binding protein